MFKKNEGLPYNLDKIRVQLDTKYTKHKAILDRKIRPNKMI